MELHSSAPRSQNLPVITVSMSLRYSLKNVGSWVYQIRNNFFLALANNVPRIGQLGTIFTEWYSLFLSISWSVRWFAYSAFRKSKLEPPYLSHPRDCSVDLSFQRSKLSSALRSPSCVYKTTTLHHENVISFAVKEDSIDADSQSAWLMSS